MGAVSNILVLIIIVLIAVIFYQKLIDAFMLLKAIISNSNIGRSLGLPGSNISFPNASSPQQSNVSARQLVNYTLHLINRDRQTYGLRNVTLSPIPSGQQHADSMLQYGYFSHWDVYGMKPYMRYALVGGTGSVQENIAYTKSGITACIAALCNTYGNLNATKALQQMEYNMMYNDSACCNNGHRDNILDPNHNQVSIGIAYNRTSIYLVEDFVDNYIDWFNSTPATGNGDVYLKGGILGGYRLSSIEISYDPPVSNMSLQQLDSTSDYSYGQAIAGIVSSPLYYYPSIATIVADNYYTNGNDFYVTFNMDKLVSQYGAGEYTTAIWLNGTASNSSFVGSTYTIFVNQNGTTYVPSSV
jgi:uncharacterized protein YkwD